MGIDLNEFWESFINHDIFVSFECHTDLSEFNDMYHDKGFRHYHDITEANTDGRDVYVYEISGGMTYEYDRYDIPDFRCKTEYTFDEVKIAYLEEIGVQQRIASDAKKASATRLKRAKADKARREKKKEEQEAENKRLSALVNAQEITPIKEKTNKIEGDDDMKMNFKKIFGEMGKTENGELALTMSGKIAVKRNEDEFVRYNPESETIENQMNFVIKEAADMIFVMPSTEVEEDDIIKAKKTYYQVVEVLANGNIKAVNIKNGTKSTIIKETNIMGFSFYYKVISLFQTVAPVAKTATLSPLDDDNCNEDEVVNKQPAMNPLMMMMLMGDDDAVATGAVKKADEADGMSMKDIMMMQMFSGGQQAAGGMNPMMMMLMMGDKGGAGGSSMKDMMMMQMVMGQGQGAAKGGMMGGMDPMMMMFMMGK